MKKTCRPRKKIGLLSFALLIVFLFASACGTAPHPDADSLPPSSAVSRDEDSSVQPASLPPVSSEPEAAVAHTMDDFISYYWRHPIDTDLSALRNETISQVTGNGLCTYILTESGRVFGCGFSLYHALAQNTEQPVVGLVEIKPGEKIKMIRAGDYGACAVGESNDIYFWGRCFDQPCSSAVALEGSEPVRVPFGKPIRDIQMQMRRIVILTEEREVYAFGENYVSEGTVRPSYNGYSWSEETWLVPQKIVLPEPAVQICTTSSSIAILGADGNCYTAYDSQYTWYPSVAVAENPQIRKIDFDRPVVSIGTGDDTVFLVTASHELYAAGNNLSGNMGLGENASSLYDTSLGSGYEIVKAVTKIPTEEPVAEVKSTVTIAFACWRSTSGHIYVAGRNSTDFLLTGQSSQAASTSSGLSVFTRVALPDNMTAFGCRGPLYWYRTPEGKVFAAGLNNYGNALGVPRADRIYGPNIIREPYEIPLSFSPDCRFD